MGVLADTQRPDPPDMDQFAVQDRGIRQARDVPTDEERVREGVEGTRTVSGRPGAVVAVMSAESSDAGPPVPAAVRAGPQPASGLEGSRTDGGRRT